MFRALGNKRVFATGGPSVVYPHKNKAISYLFEPGGANNTFGGTHYGNGVPAIGRRQCLPGHLVLSKAKR